MSLRAFTSRSKRLVPSALEVNLPKYESHRTINWKTWITKSMLWQRKSRRKARKRRRSALWSKLTRETEMAFFLENHQYICLMWHQALRRGKLQRLCQNNPPNPRNCPTLHSLIVLLDRDYLKLSIATIQVSVKIILWYNRLCSASCQKSTKWTRLSAAPVVKSRVKKRRIGMKRVSI